CFVQNRWEEGLKHLALCQDPVLSGVAELDLNTPRSGAPDPKIAEAWWDYAKNAPAYDQWSAQSRARYWYTRCLPGLTGLNKLNAEKRLAFTSGGTEYRPGLFCEFTAKQVSVLKGKKARIDPVVDFSGSEFAEPKKTTDLTLKWTGALVPPQAGRYRLSASTGGAVRIRVEGKVVIDTTLPKASRKEALVPLGERATPIVIEFFCQNTDRHKLQLLWALPGRSEQQPIAAEYLFHDKKVDAALGK
ncbi:MAG TPA: PA14 domain-containing protein, partial [Gemmata sp.]|nr:PA14 domain-containing protein [Gemmata sp.]